MPNPNLKHSTRHSVVAIMLRFRSLSIVAVTLAMCGVVIAEDKEDSSKTLSAEALKAFQAEAAEYVIRHEGINKSFRLKTDPILRWTNPVREGQDGAVFLWTLNERPEVIGCCFTYPVSGIVYRKHQLHSLSTKPLLAKVDGAVVWQPREAGLRFAAIPKAKAPAKTPARQMIQMRQLARRFAVRIENSDQQRSELRLMPTPLATYTPKNEECAAGALFSFAQGTDPDAILVIENRMVNSVPTWTWAFARFHYDKLTATLDDKPVWTVRGEIGMKRDFRSKSQFRNSTYVSFKPQ